jgi:hypothetical protein
MSPLQVEPGVIWRYPPDPPEDDDEIGADWDEMADWELDGDEEEDEDRF